VGVIYAALDNLMMTTGYYKIDWAHYDFRLADSSDK
jgi:hypothetical protein